MMLGKVQVSDCFFHQESINILSADMEIKE